MLGIGFLAIFLILVYSRVLEVVTTTAFRIPLIIGGAAALCAFFSGRLQIVGRSWVTRLTIAFTLWFVVCIPFAFWRTGSLQLLADRWIKSVIVFFCVATLIATTQQLRRISILLLASVTLGALLTIPYRSGADDGRLAMARGEFANANQLAMVALMVLPFALHVILDSTRLVVTRMMAAGAGIFLVITILHTGSRTGLLGLFLFGALLLFVLPPVGKLATVATGLLAIVLAIVLLPGQVAVRLGSILAKEDVQSAEEAEILNSSKESSANRLQLLKEGVRYTLESPVVGVGPGNFVERRNIEYRALYGRQGYLSAHNSYIQTASEMGIPGFLLFSAILVFCYRNSTRIYKQLKQDLSPEAQQIRSLALTLRIAVALLALFSFFNHIAYDLYIPTIAGLLVALEGIAGFYFQHRQNQLQFVGVPAAQPVLAAAGGVRQTQPACSNPSQKATPSPASIEAMARPLGSYSSRTHKFGRLRRPSAPQDSANGHSLRKP